MHRSFITKILLCSLFILSYQLFSSAQTSKELRISENGTFIWYAFTENGRMGAMDSNGIVLVPARYKSVDYYSNQVFLVTDNLSRQGIYSKTGKELVPCLYYQLSMWNGVDTYVGVYDLYHYLLYDFQGNIAIGAEKGLMGISVYSHKNGISFVYLDSNNKTGILDSSLREIIPTGKYDAITPVVTKDNIFYFSCVEFHSGNSSDIYDYQGKLIATSKTPFVQISSDPSGKEYFLLPGNVSNGRIELDGTKKSEAQISKVLNGNVSINGQNFSMYLNANNRLSVNNASGKEVIPNIYDNVIPIDNGNTKGFILCKESYRGWADCNGRIIVSPDRYAQVSCLPNALLCRNMDGTKELLSIDGNIIISNKYGFPSSVSVIEQGTFVTVVDKISGLSALFKCIGTDGDAEQVTPFMYKDFQLMQYASEYFYPIDELGNVGIIDYQGNILCYPQYGSISYSYDGECFILKDGSYQGVLKRDLSFCIEPTEFTSIFFDKKNKQFIAVSPDRKCLFDNDGNMIQDSHPARDFEEYMTKADDYFEQGRFDSASDFYTKALSINPKAYVYYNRGICYYNNDKYDLAIADFKKCLDNNPTPSTRSKAYDMIDKSNYYKSEVKQKRIRKAFNILGFVVNVANAIVNRNNSYYAQCSTYTPLVPSQMNCYNPSNYDPLYNAIMNQALQQSQEQMEREYNLYRSFYPNATMEDYVNAKNLAAYNMSNGNYDSNNNLFSNNSEISSSSGTYDYRQSYSRWENQAKSVYESMTIGGYSTSSGGHANLNDLPAGGYMQYHNLLRSAQAEMRKTRIEAANAGVNIPESTWETITVDAYK